MTRPDLINTPARFDVVEEIAWPAARYDRPRYHRKTTRSAALKPLTCVCTMLSPAAAWRCVLVPDSAKKIPHRRGDRCGTIGKNACRVVCDLEVHFDASRQSAERHRIVDAHVVVAANRLTYSRVETALYQVLVR